jgi:hypothetical protein
MQIRFQIEYGYTPHWKNNFNAVVSAWLPKQPGEDIVAYCYQCEFGTEKITHYSGKEDGKWRVVKFHFDAETLESLNEKILKTIEEYGEKVSKNVKMVEEMKKMKTEFVRDFPDPVETWE